MTRDASLEQELRDVFQRHEHLAEDLDPLRPAGGEPSGSSARASTATKSAKTKPPKKAKTRRRDPGWARALVVVGALMMVAAGGAFVVKDVVFGYATRSVKQETLLPTDAGDNKKRVTINGPKNILLIGIDPRPDQSPTDPVRSDSILILHIPASHDAAFLVSVPRDTWVRIPRYDNGKHKFGGGQAKINAAFAEGGTGLAGKEQRRHGTTLLANTIKEQWGIRFDAAAIVDFVGFQDVVKVLGGVDMYIDQRTISVHIGYDKNGKVKMPFHQRDNGQGGTTLIPVPGVTPKVYEVGHRHLEPWEALDYVRQRETLPNSDYDRQRHQQQFIKALFKKIASKEVLGNPSKLNAVLDVVGRAMTLDPGGIGLDDWVFAMKGISGDSMLTLKTNNGTFHSSSSNSGAEALDETTLALLDAIKNATVPGFVASNPAIVSAN